MSKEENTKKENTEKNNEEESNKELELKLKDIEEKTNEKEKIKIYKKDEIEKQKDELNSTINDIWNNSNKQVIEKLVKTIHELTFKGKNELTLKGKNEILDEKDENEFNIQNIKAISLLCQKYFGEELDSSYGLTFLIYFFEKNEKLMKDIKYYTEKKDWEKDEMEIKEKKPDSFEIIDYVNIEKV